MRKTLTFFILILSCQVYFFNTQALAVAKILAIVNNDVITEKDLEDSLRIARVQLVRQYKGKELDKQIELIKKDLLRQLIEQRLMLQEANGILEDARKAKDSYAIYHLEVKNDKIKASMEDIKKQYPSEEVFQKDLDKEGLTQADIQKRIKEQLLVENVIDYWVKGQVTVRPEEVTEYYSKNPSDFDSGEEREVLVVTLDNNDLATSLSYNLRTGQKLDDLATRYPFTVNTLTANKKKGELRKDIEGVIFKLGLNEVSNPLKIDDKYFVFILQNIIPSRHLPLSQVQPLVYNFIYRQKVHDQMMKWLDELKKKSYIKIK